VARHQRRDDSTAENYRDINLGVSESEGAHGVSLVSAVLFFDGLTSSPILRDSAGPGRKMDHRALRHLQGCPDAVDSVDVERRTPGNFFCT
jgi:hypothetical protein